MNLSCCVCKRSMSCSLLVTSVYLNSVRVDTQIGGNRESGVLLVGVDGGIYELVFGSNAGNFKLFVIFDFEVCRDSDPPLHGDDNSPENSIVKLKCVSILPITCKFHTISALRSCIPAIV